MSLRVDLSGRCIIASVRSLVELDAGPGHSRVHGRGDGLRAAVGVEIHREYRDRHSTVPGFLPELEVATELEVDGFAVALRGFADGVFERPDALMVEEVKSVPWASDRLSVIGAAARPHACFQVALYGLCLRAYAGSRPIRLRLHLVSVVDGARRTIEVPFDPTATLGRLQRSLREAIRGAKVTSGRAKMRRRWARRLVFPHPQLRRGQQELIEQLECALNDDRPAVARAPTGLGKTACGLLPALRHALRRDASVFYATARGTHQQLAASTFERLCTVAEASPPALTAITLRAKSQMCPPGDLCCHPDACPLLEDFDERLERSGIVEQLVAAGSHVHPDQVYARGEAARLCPYEIALAIASRADLVIGDYNYAFDRRVALRRFDPDDPEPTVVVIDEVHNLDDRARGYDSPFLSRAAVQSAGVGIHDTVDPTLGPALGGLLQRVATRIDGLRVAAAADQRPGMDGCVPIELEAAAWGDLATRARRLALRHRLYRHRQGRYEPDDPTQQVLRTVAWIDDSLRWGEDSVVPYVAGPTGPRGIGVGLQCVDPSRRLEACHLRALATIGLSATIRASHEGCRRLGFARLDPRIIDLGSPFPPEHRHIAVVPTVDTRYRCRDGHVGEVARIIEQVVEARPGNYAAFFSSFAFLAKVRDALTVDRDRILVQLPMMPAAMRTRMLGELRRGAQRKGGHAEGQGRLLLAVSGGVFAEGIDLPGDALLGVVVVGPSLPPVGFERELIRQHHDHRHLGDGDPSGFACAYVFPAMQRVVQAAGRVIRSASDRGVVVLVGRRFTEPGYRECLPTDWYDVSPAELVAEDLSARLARFWSAVDIE